MSYDPFAVPVEPQPPAKPANGRHPDTADIATEPSYVPAGAKVAVFDNGRCVATIPAGCEWYEADPFTGKIVRHIEPGEDLAGLLELK